MKDILLKFLSGALIALEVTVAVGGVKGLLPRGSMYVLPFAGAFMLLGISIKLRVEYEEDEWFKRLESNFKYYNHAKQVPLQRAWEESKILKHQMVR